MHRCRAAMSATAHALRRSNCTEHHLTARPADPSSPTDAQASFDALADELTERRAVVVAEKIYGTSRAHQALLAARENAWRSHGLDTSTPVHVLDGAPCGGGDFAGTQVWAVSAPPGEHVVDSVPGGRLWRLPQGRLLHLTGVHGGPHGPFADQAERMFQRAATLAEQSGFDFARTVRTWIYLPELLRDYSEFNRVRSARYRRHDFAWPASTGIQARAGNSACTMDVLLAEGIDVHHIDRTARQGPPSAYGSAFSRAVRIRHADGTTVHVSGTASIDNHGQSRHHGDATAQYLETLLDVGAVLGEAGLGHDDIVQATLFCKNDAVHAACLQAHELLGLRQLPLVAVRADVCRPELLVELEAIACR